MRMYVGFLRCLKALLFSLLAWYGAFCSSSSPAATSGKMTLRVRMPQGEVKKVETTADMTIEVLKQQLGLHPTTQLKKDAQQHDSDNDEGNGDNDDSDVTDQSGQSVAELGLKHGDILYTQGGVDVTAAMAAAAKAKAKQLANLRNEINSEKMALNLIKQSPYPKLARPWIRHASASNTNVQHDLKDIEALVKQIFTIMPQKHAVIKQVSVAEAAFDDISAYIRQACKLKKLKGHVCAMLFGTVNPKTKAIRVEAIFEPPQPKPNAKLYDASKLLAGLKKQHSNRHDDDDDSGDRSAADKAKGMTEIERACKVAKLLGLQPVGWCLSHDKRDYFLSAADVAIAAKLQAWTMTTFGRDLGVFQVTIALPVDRKNNEVAAEAYAVSNITVQMSHEGVISWPQPQPSSNMLNFTETVQEGNRKMNSVNTTGLNNAVPIVKHKGQLRVAFPQVHRHTQLEGKIDTVETLYHCLFEPSKDDILDEEIDEGKRQDGGKIGGAKATKKTAISHGKGKSNGKASANALLLRRLSDFNLLVHLSRKLGMGPEFVALCKAVREKDSSSPVISKLKPALKGMTVMPQ